MEESDLHRTRSMVLSGRSLQEVSRLSAELEAEAARSRLLAAQLGGPREIVRALAAELGSACVCLLESGGGWRSASEREVTQVPAAVGLLLEQLSLREIYVRPTPSSSPFLNSTLSYLRWTAAGSSPATCC